MRMWIVIEKMFTKVLFFSAYQVFRQTWLWWSGFRFEPILANTSATPKNTTYIKGGQKLLKNNHLTYLTKVQFDTLFIPWFSDTTLQVFFSKSIELLKIKKLNHICRCSMMTICHVGWQRRICDLKLLESELKQFDNFHSERKISMSISEEFALLTS